MPPACCPEGSHQSLRPDDGLPAAGEFITLSETADDCNGFEAYIVMPKGKPARGCVLMFHDVMGLHVGRHVAICDAFAE